MPYLSDKKSVWKLVYITENSIIVENGSIGYEIFVPLSVAGRIGQIGNEVKIYTYMYIREDLLQLFGFIEKDELDLFKLLITVSGIGPKGALGILGSMSADDLRFAVLADDVKTISKAPGIGTKTAGKLILELKDKLKLKNVVDDSFEKGSGERGFGNSDDTSVQMVSDAISALAALGYSPSDAMKAVKSVASGTYSTVEELLKLSLKRI